MLLRNCIEPLINIVYPLICIGCNKPNHNKENNGYLCNDCFYAIKRHIPPFCLKCGRGLLENKILNNHNGICAHCLNRQYHFSQAWSICGYEGIIKELIHRFKYSQKIQYSIIFEKLIDEFVGAFNILADIDFIIPIPLHPVKLREREYNQSQIIASLVSRIIGKPMANGILTRIRNTKPQINLDEKSRIKNIIGCFKIKDGLGLKLKNILLVDDVFTTGITISEAAKVIKEFKPNKIYALALAG